MSSVTRRIKEYNSQVGQPRGGFIKPSDFKVKNISDNYQLNNENVHASIIGMAVDYLTRFMMGAKLQDAFSISLLGANLANMFNLISSDLALEYLENITGIDEMSVISACKLVTYDVWYRNPFDAIKAKTARDTNPDSGTVHNIQIMVQRSIKFWEEYGPVIKDGFTFEGGYTDIISAGDGDYLTADTLWDFKVLKAKPTKNHTLQLLIYYLIGQRSIHPEFKDIDKLGIFNPRLNTVYTINIKDIPDTIIKKVSTDVIGYKI